MDALIIGPPDALADAIARSLRRSGMTALRALAADARDHERATWLLDEAGHPPLVVVLESSSRAYVRFFFSHRPTRIPGQTLESLE